MHSLGEKIKARRKELRLTLKQLAGSDFSYSLLSQIENNKANPSMETLHKLASKLDMPISALLNNQNYVDYKSLLKTCEKKFVMEYERDAEVDQAIKEQIEAVLENLSFQHYEEVRLIEMYCMCTYFLGNELPFDLFSNVITFYEEIGNTNKFVQAKIFLIRTQFDNQQFTLSKQTFQPLIAFVEEHDYLLETSVLLDFYYLKGLIESATGDYATAAQSVEQGLTIAHKYSLYKKHARLLQLGCFIYVQLEDSDKAWDLLKKFKTYAQFTENIYEFGFYQYIYFYIENRLNEEKSITEEIIQFIEESTKFEPYTISTIFTQELAYSYWKQHDEQKVIEVLENHFVPPYLIYPLDIACGMETLAIRAYCYNNIGLREKAVEEIVAIHQKVKDFPDSTFKRSIINIYKELLLL